MKYLFLLTLMAYLSHAHLIIKIDDQNHIFCEQKDIKKLQNSSKKDPRKCVIENQNFEPYDSLSMTLNPPEEDLSIEFINVKITSGHILSNITIDIPSIKFKNSEIKSCSIRVFSIEFEASTSQFTFSRLIFFKSDAIIFHESEFLSTINFSISDFKSIFPNFWANSKIFEGSAFNYLLVVKDITRDDIPFLLEVNNFLIISKKIEITESTILCAFFSVIALETAIIDSKIKVSSIKVTDNNRQYYTFEKRCGEIGGNNFNVGGFAKQRGVKNINIEFENNEFCRKRSLLNLEQINGVQMTRIIKSGNIGSVSDNIGGKAFVSGVIMIASSNLILSQKSMFDASGNLNEVVSNDYGSSSGGSILLISDYYKLHGSLSVKGGDSDKIENGEGAGGIFFLVVPQWSKNNRITAQETEIFVDLKQGDRFKNNDVSLFDKIMLSGESGTFYKSPCLNGGTNIYCNRCPEGKSNPYLINLDCRKCPDFNQNVAFKDDICYTYSCVNNFLPREINPYCLDSLNYFYFYLKKGTEKLIVFFTWMVITFFFSLFIRIINHFSENKQHDFIRIKSMNNGFVLKMRILVGGENEYRNPWSISIKNYERTLSSIPNGNKITNIFRNLNRDFKWKFLYSVLSNIAAFFSVVLGEYLTFRYKKKIYNRATKYIQQIEKTNAGIFETIMIKFVSDSNYNNLIIQIFEKKEEYEPVDYLMFISRFHVNKFLKEKFDRNLFPVLLKHSNSKSNAKIYVKMKKIIKKLLLIFSSMPSFNEDNVIKVMLTLALLFTKQLNELLIKINTHHILRCGILVQINENDEFRVLFIDTLKEDLIEILVQNFKKEASKTIPFMNFYLYFYTLKDDMSNSALMQNEINYFRDYSITLFDKILTKTKKKGFLKRVFGWLIINYLRANFYMKSTFENSFFFNYSFIQIFSVKTCTLILLFMDCVF